MKLLKKCPFMKSANSIAYDSLGGALYLHGIILLRRVSSMKIRLPILISIVFFFSFSILTHTCLAQIAKEGEGSITGKDSNISSPPGIDDYEKEKLAKFKANIGKRYLTVKKINPVEFFQTPDDLEKKLTIKREKEGFVITDVVQNPSGTMNFYQVKLDTGQIGYLSADGHYLELKIKEGSLIYTPKRRSTKKGSGGPSASATQAMELVRNHPTPIGSVEKRMSDQKAKSFPFPRWRYEAKEIGEKKFRVLQYVEERSAPVFVRTWIVDVSTKEIKPENLAAKEMYR